MYFYFAVQMNLVVVVCLFVCLFSCSALENEKHASINLFHFPNHVHDTIYQLHYTNFVKYAWLKGHINIGGG